jgi:hypothetical protein
MPESDHDAHAAIRETAYYIWEQEGRPEGRAEDHWVRAIEGMGDKPSQESEPMEEEEKLLAGRHDVNLPALLTKDVPGG